ncbi:beta/gamma crystallin domain-containing protein [Azohydromonas australica]|uniref:beta/gamma crystallin domain-containing protein n=1 Tax=Azohydromonas australica TaxID=364039 RepID=UPI0004205561|nr:beta/gamma crystallin domain-containing protein [Azohydromonas australica]
MFTRNVVLAAGLFLSLGCTVSAQGDLEVNKPYRVGEAVAPAPYATDPRLDGILVLMPAAQGNSDGLGNGCWVRFYDGKNFRGQMLTLVGPVDLPRMDVAKPAWREWDSAIVGPKAKVATYDKENYRDRTATLSAGQRIPSLDDAQLGWFEDIESVRVSCSG